MTHYPIFGKIIFTSLVISIFSCTGNKNSSTEEGKIEILPENIVELREDQVKLAEIETGNIEMLAISATIKVNGIVTVAPQNHATVCMPMGGFVKSISLTPGSPVKKGQVLAIMENQEFIDIQQKYLEAKINFEYAEAEYNRHTELYKNDVYSEQNLQEVTSGYKSLKAQVKGLEQKLSMIGINHANLHEEDISSSVALLSPISGFIKDVNVNIGKFASPSDILFEIVNDDNLLLELTLFEKDSDKIFSGQKIRFFINNESEQHDALIYQTGRSISADKTYKVYAKVPGDCKNVLPGMYVNAIIETSGDEVAALPSESIVSFNDKDYIFVFEKNKEEDGISFTEFRIVEVQKGVSDDGFTEIIVPDGFEKKQAKVVIKGAYNLLSAKKNAGEMAC